jgi:Tfp pilus assembly protein FimT
MHFLRRKQIHDFGRFRSESRNTVDHTKLKTNDTRQRRSARAQAGYTLIEFVITAAILMVIAAMAVFQMQPAYQEFQASAAVSQVKSAMRQARETAISDRRTIMVEFVAAGSTTQCPSSSQIYYCMEFFVFNASGGVATPAATPYLTQPLAKNVSFMTFTGETDTPDAFGLPGVPAGVSFSGAVGNMQFNTDGTFSDSTAVPMSGTLFLGVPGKAVTEGAVTILGTTGRVRSYRGNGSAPTGWTQ